MMVGMLPTRYFSTACPFCPHKPIFFIVSVVPVVSNKKKEVPLPLCIF